MRLGKHERRILLEAPPISKCGWRASLEKGPTYRFAGLVSLPGGPGRSAEEAHRRALRKLVAAGLVETRMSIATYRDDFDGEVPEWVKADKARSRYQVMGRKRQAVKLTPLGERVVETYRDELEAGRPIRWAKHATDLEALVHRPLGDLLDLLDRGAIGSNLFHLDFGARLSRDPALKEQAARKIAALKKTRDVVRELITITTWAQR